MKNGYVMMSLSKRPLYVLVQDAGNRKSGSNRAIVIVAAAALYMRSKKAKSA